MFKYSLYNEVDQTCAGKHLRMNLFASASATGHTLSQSLLTRIEGGGRYSLFALEHAEAHSFTNLAYAGQYAGKSLDCYPHESREDLDAGLIRLLTPMLEPNSIAIWENPFAQPEDPYVAKFRSPHFFSGKAVYHAVREPDSSQIDAVIHECRAPFLCAAVAKSVHSPRPSDGPELIPWVVEYIQLVWTCCLDGEAWLLWFPDIQVDQV